MSSDNRKPTSDDAEAGFNSSRAELFDALGHPTRIRILQVLSQRAMSFSELKKEVGIESSGHLTFHLGKLNLLLRVNLEGLYELTDDGREALHLAEVMSTTSSPSAAANSIESGRNSGYQFFPAGWQTVTFNDTQGKLLAEFNFWPGGLPAAANATEQTTGLMVQISHSAGTHLDSLKLGFVASNPSSCNCFLMEQVASLGIGGFPPVPSQLYYQNGVTTFNVQNFGYVGIASVSTDFLILLTRSSNLAVESENNSLVLNIELMLHATNKIMIGQDYVGEASVPLNIMPNGLIALANTATT
jgi:DNA-binding transcriptional ArsR family regulator